ncbi:hypothetical protein NDU88_002043 [Pleurodeles waltl]|uniref:Uncharacterized protein n=1 Tax=Pleurodeles waltl TaxID=8319 RepID=A0AAV7SAQ7_PLEWA|nr:hypothetical protein NDU88_002043 [Pleurodeles waltl]
MGKDRANKGTQQTRMDQYTAENVGVSLQKDPPATSEKGTEPTGAYSRLDRFLLANDRSLDVRRVTYQVRFLSDYAPLLLECKAHVPKPAIPLWRLRPDLLSVKRVQKGRCGGDPGEPGEVSPARGVPEEQSGQAGTVKAVRGQTESRTSVERGIRRCAFKVGIGRRVESRRSVGLFRSVEAELAITTVRRLDAQQPAAFQEERGLGVWSRGTPERKRGKEIIAPLLTKRGHIPYIRNRGKIR